MSSLASSMDSDSTTCTDKYGRELPPKAFRSKRLEVISYNTRDHDEFFNSIQQYSSSIINFCASTPRPMDLKFTSSVANHQKKSHLFVIIYGAYDDYDDDVVPIGTLFLEASPRDMTHHRCSKLGIGILNRFRRYEAEAVNWALNWAFNSAGSTPGGDEYSDMEHASELTDGKRRECYYKKRRVVGRSEPVYFEEGVEATSLLEINLEGLQCGVLCFFSLHFNFWLLE